MRVRWRPEIHAVEVGIGRGGHEYRVNGRAPDVAVVVLIESLGWGHAAGALRGQTLETGPGCGGIEPAERVGCGNPVAVVARFEEIVESADSGLRKPDPRIYLLMCEKLGLQPRECVYLDDLGINCKPAAALGMHAIKVTNPLQALQDLSRILQLDLLG